LFDQISGFDIIVASRTKLPRTSEKIASKTLGKMIGVKDIFSNFRAYKKEVIPNYGIIGLIATKLTAGIPSLIAGLWWIKKHFKVTIEWASSAKILLSSALAALITYATISQLDTANWIKLAIGTITFLISYMIASPLTGAINTTDTQNLKEMLKELGPLTRIFNIPLNMIEKTLIVLQKEKNRFTHENSRPKKP